MTTKDEQVLTPSDPMQWSFLDVLENKHVDSPQKSMTVFTKKKGEEELKNRLARLKCINLVLFGVVLFCSAFTVMGLY
jgi:hypothetical protein